MKLFQENPASFDLVITDQTMPGITGGELATQLLELQPDIPIVICTGYSALISAEQANKMGIREFIMKPWSRRDLAKIAHDILSK